MNLDDSPEEAAYRARVRAWIAENGPDLSQYSTDELRAWSETHKDIAHKWQNTKADGGYACINWPVEHGGAGGTTIEATIFAQEELKAGLRFRPVEATAKDTLAWYKTQEKAEKGRSTLAGPLQHAVRH